MELAKAMERNPKEVRVEHYYLGPGKGSSFKAVHLPTGIAVAETVSTNSSEPSSVVTGRLIAALKEKIQNASNERS